LPNPHGRHGILQRQAVAERSAGAQSEHLDTVGGTHLSAANDRHGDFVAANDQTFWLVDRRKDLPRSGPRGLPECLEHGFARDLRQQQGAQQPGLTPARSPETRCSDIQRGFHAAQRVKVHVTVHGPVDRRIWHDHNPHLAGSMPVFLEAGRNFSLMGRAIMARLERQEVP
jgi:hypothetical protein